MNASLLGENQTTAIILPMSINIGTPAEVKERKMRRVNIESVLQGRVVKFGTWEQPVPNSRRTF